MAEASNLPIDHFGGATPRAPCWHGRVLRIADSTSLSQPASTGTDWWLHGVYDLGRGGFSHLERCA